MKGTLFSIYLVVAIIFGTYGHFFGPNQYRGFAYNLGTGFTWPITIWKSDPELDGSNDQAFALSLDEMARTYPLQALRIDYAIGIIMVLTHAESDESVDGDQIRSMFNPGGQLPKSMFTSLWQVHALKEKMLDRLDGMELDDLLDEAEDAREELFELAEERPAQPKQPLQAMASNQTVDQAGEACYEEKLAAFREYNGEDAPVRYDVIEEWRGECGLPPSE